MSKPNDVWNSGDPYEFFMGRWSSLLAPEFLSWLQFPKTKSWLDLGCGTGALSEAIITKCEPSYLASVDPSDAFLNKANQRLNGKAEFFIATASSLTFPDRTFDVVVSGLALNFFRT